MGYMKTYHVSATETIEYCFVIRAETEQHAVDTAYAMFTSGEPLDDYVVEGNAEVWQVK